MKYSMFTGLWRHFGRLSRPRATLRSRNVPLRVAGNASPSGRSSGPRGMSSSTGVTDHLRGESDGSARSASRAAMEVPQRRVSLPLQGRENTLITHRATRHASPRFLASLRVVASPPPGENDLVIGPEHAERDVTIGQYDGRRAGDHRDDPLVLLEGPRRPFLQARMIGLGLPGEWPVRIDRQHERRTERRNREHEATYFRLPKHVDIGIETPSAKEPAAGRRAVRANAAAVAGNRMVAHDAGRLVQFGYAEYLAAHHAGPAGPARHQRILRIGKVFGGDFGEIVARLAGQGTPACLNLGIISVS
jgi:hypothetical protein